MWHVWTGNVRPPPIQVKEMDPWKPITKKDLLKHSETHRKLEKAEDWLDFTLNEKLDIIRPGNITILEAGLCDGQKCIHHVTRPAGVRGCGCRLSNPDKPYGKYFEERHRLCCSLNGNNENPEFGCKGYRPDPDKDLERKMPSHMKRLHGRKVI